MKYLSVMLRRIDPAGTPQYYFLQFHIQRVRQTKTQEVHL